MTASNNSISTILEALNEPQREAVTTAHPHVLVVAGAGSGKTRVITYRIAHLLLGAHARSESILALTFTNKAAGEMKSRVAALSGQQFNAPWISTFHSFGALFLRRHIPLLGFQRDFVVYDEDDQLELLKECCRELELPDTRYNPRDLQFFMKWQKSHVEAAEIYDSNVSKLLQLYNRKLADAHAVDFEDLLVFPLRILRENQNVLERYRHQYRFLMVDEYQDTNEIQYELLKLLAGAQSNILVVGDEDQSIYKFRGARAENIQFFLRDFPDAKVIKLEQNYRSTKTILKAAQAVISRNSSRIKKELWTERAAGEPVEIYHAYDEHDEATFVTLRVMAALKEVPAEEIGVVYRTNAQSRVLEESFGKAQIPHRIVGGVGFYERREVKDVIAFLRVLANRSDNLSLLRIINVPPRGVGKKLLQQIQSEAESRQISLFEAARSANSRNLSLFLSYFDNPGARPASAFLDELLKGIEYETYLRKEDPLTADERMENVSEFISYLKESEQVEGFDLSVFLSDLPLQSARNEEGRGVTLLTVHSAKGLEFRIVFVVGLEEGLFPHVRSLEKTEDVEEERRLCYVALTRAKEKLWLSWAQRRGIFGAQTSCRPSRFLEEIPSWFKVNRISERFGTGQRIAADSSTDSSASAEFRVGSHVHHDKFGRGTVLLVEGVPNDWKLTIRFAEGTKKILTRYAQLRIEN